MAWARRMSARRWPAPDATVFSSPVWKKPLPCAGCCRDARIFVLEGAPADAVPALMRHRLTPVLNSLAEIAAWSAAANVGRDALDAVIHIDTGMNRLGLAR